jgi:UDP-N-acetylmuramoylalanine--D-glutamate ligase
MLQAEEKKNMLNMFRDKNILVIGLARSGIGAANLLSVLGARVSIMDKKPRSMLETNIMRLLPSVNVITDGNYPDIFNNPDMIVVSPGVPLSIPDLVQARGKGIPVIGELELAYQTVVGRELRDKTEPRNIKRGSRNSHPATPHFIGVTGTNGKSTTATLIDLMLKESGYKTILGGNIGNAVTAEILNTLNIRRKSTDERLFDPAIIDYIVAEISSFQLETINEFRPGTAAILNITPDHLDRYEGMDDYINAKARIFENQTAGDYLILNADDPVIMELYDTKLKTQHVKLPEILFFSRRRQVKGVYFKKGEVYCDMPRSLLPSPGASLISSGEIKIGGIHNLENAMAASLIALISGCPPQVVRNTLRSFPGLEHRLEFVGESKGVRFINDSKGTNVGAVAKSLEGFENVILIMGGRDKDGDFSILRDLIKRKAKLLILLGEAGEKIGEKLKGMTDIYKVNDFREAVDMSMAKASTGDVVLLSPGCASFDMFADFEDRGRKFKEAVREILE